MSGPVILFLVFLSANEALGDGASCAPGAVRLHLSASAARNSSGRWQLAAAATSDAATARPSARVGVDAQLTLKMADACAEQGGGGGGDGGGVWTTVAVTAHVDTAPLGYESMPISPAVTSLYRMHIYAHPWVKAAAVCASEGAHLIVINSDAEALVVNEYWGRKPTFVGATNPSWFYVGVTRTPDGRNETVLGGDLEDTGYVRWAPDGWDRIPTSQCGIIDRRNLLGFDACHYARPFICERET